MITGGSGHRDDAKPADGGYCEQQNENATLLGISIENAEVVKPEKWRFSSEKWPVILQF